MNITTRLTTQLGRQALQLLFGVLLALPAISAERTLVLPESVQASALVHEAARDGLWEKTLTVRFPAARRTISTSDGLLDVQLAINHAAHPLLWKQLGGNGKHYVHLIRDATARRFGLVPGEMAGMATAADMDNLAVVTRSHGPLSVTVLATAGARTNAIRTGVDSGSHVEEPDKVLEERPAGTINILVLTNIALSDAALARALITVTEGKTAALEDLKVPSSYTHDAQATGTGTDSIIVVSGTGAPRATYTGGHSRIGELIGKATHAAVIESLGKQNGFFLPGAKRFPVKGAAPTKAGGDLRLALLHLAPVPGDIPGNRFRIEAAIQDAVRQGADWVITPELAETGYNFAKHVGTGWIAPFPDAWIHTLAAIARDNGVALFVGFAERDKANGRLHNSVAVIDRGGNILGSYRKQRPVGRAEAWSIAGSDARPFLVDGIAVGTLICADAWQPEVAAVLVGQGAQILLSPANWPPVDGMGPGDVWERRSRETGVPLIAVNRGGREPELDFSTGESAVSLNGKRLFSHSAPTGGVFYVDWDRKRRFLSVSPN